MGRNSKILGLLCVSLVLQTTTYVIPINAEGTIVEKKQIYNKSTHEVMEDEILSRMLVGDNDEKIGRVRNIINKYRGTRSDILQQTSQKEISSEELRILARAARKEYEKELHELLNISRKKIKEFEDEASYQASQKSHYTEASIRAVIGFSAGGLVQLCLKEVDQELMTEEHIRKYRGYLPPQCRGFVYGVIGGYTAAFIDGSKGNTRFCIPIHATMKPAFNAELIDSAVMRYFMLQHTSNTPSGDKSASELVIEALEASYPYPCQLSQSG